MWMKNVAFHISKQRMLLPGSHKALRLPELNPQEIQGREEHSTDSRQLRCMSKEWFRWARLLHLPMHRKALINSLTWCFFFLQLSEIFWCATTWFISAELIYTLAPSLSLCSSPSELRACLLGFSPPYVCKIKHKHSTFWLCVLFISLNTSLQFSIDTWADRKDVIDQSFVILPVLSKTL